MTSDELLPLPERELFEAWARQNGVYAGDGITFKWHMNESDVAWAAWLARANLQAAKPADALGSLPVVAWRINTGHGSSVKEWIPEEHRSFWKPLTDHAQATAEIAKLRELLNKTGNTLTDEIAKRDETLLMLADANKRLADEKATLRAKLAGVDGLAQALRKAECQIMALAPAGYIAPALGAIHAALATYEAAQGENGA